MISVSEAKELVQKNCDTAKISVLPLLEAKACILAEIVLANHDTPPFHQSAMDGYAFSFDAWDGKSNLVLTEEIQAGNYSSRLLQSKDAVRIFTGAPLPAGADTVVIQEKVLANGKTIQIKDEQLQKGANVRLAGSQTKRGQVALRAGQLLTPPAISFLAGMGIDRVKVFSKPNVSIIVTGKELIKPGSSISEGKIFESNSFGLISALNQLEIQPVSVQIIDDLEEEIMQAINSKLNADMIILTGGVSVGDYDFVSSALEKCGVIKIFHKVKQKPGKPFYFGRLNHTLVFALPGNPAAVLTCFYQYIVPAISFFTRREYLKEIKLPLANDYKKKAGLTHFLKGKSSLNSVSILDNQESYLMNSFAIADCIIELGEEKEEFKTGELVSVLMII